MKRPVTEPAGSRADGTRYSLGTDDGTSDGRIAAMEEHGTAGTPGRAIDDLVAGVIGHPRYRGGFIPVWRIREAAGLAAGPSAVNGALRRLERRGRAERRHRGAGPIEWRSPS